MVETNNEKEILIVKSPISVNDYNTYGGSLSGKTIGRSYTLSEPIFTVGTNDILSLSSITIDGNTNTANNESLVKIDGGSFTLGSGAVLTHNNTMSRDSAVREESGTFTMSSGAEIKDNSSTLGGIVYVGHGTIILPNVRIGNRVVVGAGSVVTKDIPDNSVAAGNPARVIGSYDDFLKKHAAQMQERPVYHTMWTDKTWEEKEKMRRELEDGAGYDL